MKLHQLKYFYTIYQYGSFRKAAAALEVSQASVTLAIQSLEEELGIKLFDRSSKYVRLTKAGEIAVKRTENILREVRELKQLGENLNEGAKKVRLAFCYCGDLPVRIADEFVSRHPDIYVDMQQRNIQNIIPILENGEYDIGITYTDFVTENQNSIPYGKLEFGVFFPAGHPFEEYEIIKADQLRGQKLLFPSIETKTEQRIRRYYAEYKIPMEIRKTIFAMDPQIASILVEYGNEIAILPFELRDDMAGISARRMDPPIWIDQSIVWSKSKYRNEAMDKMISFLRNLRS